MWQKLLRESSFFLLLLQFDRDLAEEYRGKRCVVCGGRLDRSAYVRKPRGGPPELGEDYAVRESFCCAVEGCRRRLTPPSLRFLGRRVYLGAVVVLVSAMVHGVTEKRASSMHELCGVSVRTLRRWRKWWREQFVHTRLWSGLRGRFANRVDERMLRPRFWSRSRVEASASEPLELFGCCCHSPLERSAVWTCKTRRRCDLVSLIEVG